MAQRTNWKQHLNKQRQLSRFGASTEATVIAARLEVQLSEQVWNEIAQHIEEDESIIYPEQRRDFLIQAAKDNGVSLAGISNNGGW